MLRRSTAYMASCLLAVVLVSHGSDAASLKGQTAFGRSLTSNKKFMARLLESDCDVGFYSSAAVSSVDSPPPAYGAYPAPPAAYPPSYPPTPAYGAYPAPPAAYPSSYPPAPAYGAYPAPPAAYPSSYPPAIAYGAYPAPPAAYPPSYPEVSYLLDYTFHSASDCTPCPAGNTSPAAASSVTECTACAAGFTTSGAGGACVEIGIPALDLSKQRDVLFEFMGPDFTSFQGESQAYRDDFNSTITSKLAAAITNNDGVWLYVWRAGSIVTDNRVSFAAGTSDGHMDDAINYLVENAVSVFGDLSAFGVTGIRVGLGVGIPLIAGIIFFCIWKKRRNWFSSRSITEIPQSPTESELCSLQMFAKST
eukprot:gene21782-28801_t